MTTAPKATREPLIVAELLADANPVKQAKNHRDFVEASLSLGPTTITELAEATGERRIKIAEILQEYGANLLSRRPAGGTEAEFVLPVALSSRPEFNDGNWKPITTKATNG